MLVADAFLSLINVDHPCMRKTSFLQQCQLSSRALHDYFVITLGLLASTFKVLIGLPLVIFWPGLKEQDMMQNTSMTNMRARTLPSQNACRVKADGMGPSYPRRFPLR